MELAIPTKETPKERQKAGYWQDEIEQAQKRLRDWHKRANKIIDRYIDNREGSQTEQFRLNLFYSNVKTIQDMMYGQLPKVEVGRTHADANDDVARVAAEILERLNNLDIQRNGQDYDCIFRSCLQDRLLPGLGVARVRYEVETEEVPMPDTFDLNGSPVTQEVVVWEDAPIEYYHWQDVLWGWGRSFADLPWVAYRSYLTKGEIIKRFGPEFANQVQYQVQKANDAADELGESKDQSSPWRKAEVWEIWDKKSRRVHWFSKGAVTLLDSKEDTLGLRQFFPSPPFLLANGTTTMYMPTPDYYLAQDLYNEVDKLQTRISLLTDAVKVVGVYDTNADGLERMLKEGVDNELIPVDNWAMFAETGGLKGQVDWLPIMDVVNSLDKLRQIRDETIGLLQQIVGVNDVMRGQLQNQYEGVGQSQIKSQYGSAKMQALQDQFAQFVGDLLQLRMEVICKHFEPDTILERSNIRFGFDQQELIQQAVQLLKQPEMAYLRVKVRSETIAMMDYARLQSERTEAMNALATFLQSAGAMMDGDPNSMPYLLKLLQWMLAGYKGSQEIESVLDQAITASVERLEQEAQNPQPDPEQQKAQMEMQKVQAKLQADMQLRQQDLQADMQTQLAAHKAKMAEIQATHQSRISEIQAKLQADLAKERANMEANITATQESAGIETEKDATKAEMDLIQEGAKVDLEIEKIAAQSEADINQMIVQDDLNNEEEPRQDT